MRVRIFFLEREFMGTGMRGVARGALGVEEGVLIVPWGVENVVEGG